MSDSGCSCAIVSGVLSDGSTAYNVHVIDGTNFAIFRTNNKLDAEILAEAISECSGWEIDSTHPE